MAIFYAGTYHPTRNTASVPYSPLSSTSSLVSELELPAAVNQR